jgi:hypothetical protein
VNQNRELRNVMKMDIKKKVNKKMEKYAFVQLEKKPVVSCLNLCPEKQKYNYTTSMEDGPNKRRQAGR